ncbi:TylF/MycF/NovP-related O-methyltransferase [Congregibacter sp.]|uniref:TylF/MycF/NovP-related O-methyltransferase n=1 Tax=Congregibacter sp. TaxID=2744308 RepID=UPI003F6C12D1
MNPVRYLDLIKSTLLDTIYGSQVSTEQSWGWGDGNRAGKTPTPHEVQNGGYWPERAHTMIGRKRLDNIHNCLDQILADDVPGDFIETGVWRGGATIFMRAFLAAHEVADRRVFVADSFCGLPPPDPRYPEDENDEHHKVTFLSVSLEEVKSNFKKYDLLDSQTIFLPGFFEDTLPTAPIEQLSMLRLDGDMFSSTIQVLDTLYQKVSPGGFIVVDDYGLEGCKAAVDQFREREGITAVMERVDWSGVYWRKT